VAQAEHAEKANWRKRGYATPNRLGGLGSG